MPSQVPETTVVQRRPDGTFPKGTSGNKSGRPKSVQVPDQALVPANMDGWFSHQTGIGVPDFDKRLSHQQFPTRLTYQQAVMVWSTDDLGRRAIQDPIEDAFRQGYTVDVRDDGNFEDLKVDTLDRMTELRVDERVQRALCMERALGGSAILIGARDHRPLSAPLDPSKSHGIDWLTILEPIELQPYSYYTDINSPKYGEPETYLLTAFTTAGVFHRTPVGERVAPPESIIHETRLIVLGGIRVSKFQFFNSIAGALWGESMLTSFYEQLRDLNVAYHAAAILMTDVGQPAISIEGLMQIVAKDPRALHDRILALQNGRSTARVIILDAKEKLERETGSHLEGVPELLNALAIRFAAAIPMPLSRLMGQAPKALGNESDSETRFYYDDVRATQRNKVSPIIRPVARMVMQGLRKRKLPKRWGVKFNDLRQLDDAEMAEARLTQARTDSMVVKSGIATPNEIRRSRYVNGYSFDTKVDNHKPAPGFVAPPPHGTPGSPTNPGPAGKVPGGPGLTQHAVKSYTRKNPQGSGTEPAPKQGGDVAPGHKDARTEQEYVAGRTEVVRQALGNSHGADALVKAAESQARQEWADHASGECDPAECLLPHAGQEYRTTFAGLPVVIESPKGSTRNWAAQDGSRGSTVMNYDYGYVDGTMGSDMDAVDVYLGYDEEAPWVYVVHQMRCPDFLKFDEDKVMLGFPSADAATEAYLSQYDDERFFGGMTQMTIGAFRKKVFAQSGKLTNDNQDMIRLEEGLFVVRSSDGSKVLGRYKTKRAARKRLAQAEYFKHRDNGVESNREFVAPDMDAQIRPGEGYYHVWSRDGSRMLASYKTRSEAVTFLQQIGVEDPEPEHPAEGPTTAEDVAAVTENASAGTRVPKQRVEPWGGPEPTDAVDVNM